MDIEALFSRPEITSVKISPDGEHFALRIFRDGKHGLMFVERDGFKATGGGFLPGGEEVGDFFWVNNERVVINLQQFNRFEEAPRFYGELYAINLDGKKGELIFGYRAGRERVGTAVRQKKEERAWAEIIDLLPNDPRKILISYTQASYSRNNVSRVQYLDVYRGFDKDTGKSSKYPEARFYTDQQHEPRIITSVRADRTAHIEVKMEDGNWLELENGTFGDAFGPLAADPSGSSYFIFDDYETDKAGLFKLSLDGSGYEKLFVHDTVDIKRFIFNQDHSAVVGMMVYDGYPSYLMLSQEDENAKVFRRMLASFPGAVVNITSSSRDNKYWIVLVSSDVEPASYYLFDKENTKMKFLFKSYPELSTQKLTKMEAISYESFDGLEIHGYYSQAHNESGKPSPMIVLVHGGPRIRDYWGFHPQVQALTSAGYSVLQINYRGSKGYGKEFLHAGDKQWGKAIQRDIIAGTKWAIKHKNVLEEKVCIMGGSFGAYSAFQSASLEPDLYKCIVAAAGIYDLGLLYTKGDVKDFYWGDEYLEEVIGNDIEELKSISPVNYAEKIKADIFIAHGEKDSRAHYEHYKRMTEAMDEVGLEYESFVIKKSGHGFYSNENRISYMKKVIAFLEKNMSSN
ncbi:alpha/beta hydrolase family protein [Aurantivibrio plasticivorans]